LSFNLKPQWDIPYKKKEYIYHTYLFYVTAVQIDKYYKQKVRKKEERGVFDMDYNWN